MKNNSMKYIIVHAVVAALLFIMLAGICLGFFGCAGAGWKNAAKKAYSNAKFAPKLEEVIPGAALNSYDSKSGVFAAGTSFKDFGTSFTDYSNEFILVSDTGPAPNLGYLTLEDEIQICKSRIDYAEALKKQVIDEISRLTAVGEWQNGIRLDIAPDGTREFKQRYYSTDKASLIIRLSADEQTIEIVNSPNVITGVRSYRYAQYSGYDGEVFIHMDSYEFFQSKNSEDIVATGINYREYRKDEDGNIHSFLVQAENKEGGYDGSVTVFGGNDEILYRYWRAHYFEDYYVEVLYAENADGYINIEIDKNNYNIHASAHLLNIAKLYPEDVANARVYNNYTLRDCVGAQFLNGSDIPVYSFDGYYPFGWRATVAHYPKQDVYTASVSIYNIPMELGANDALAVFGFAFLEPEFDYSSVFNGTAAGLLSNVRMNGISEIKDMEINYANMETLSTKAWAFFNEKIAENEYEYDLPDAN